MVLKGKNVTEKRDEYFKVYFKELPKRDRVWKVIVEDLQKYISPESAVLDLGAGYCNFINHVKAGRKIAIDLFEETGKYASEEVIVHRQSVTDMGNLGSSSIDVIFASNILEHLTGEELESAISEIKRVLAPEGKLIILQPNFRYSYKRYFDDYTHRQIFTADGLSRFLEAEGFEILVRKDRFLPFSMEARLPAHPVLVKLYLRSPFKPFGGQMLLVAKHSGTIREGGDNVS